MFVKYIGIRYNNGSYYMVNCNNCHNDLPFYQDKKMYVTSNIENFKKDYNKYGDLNDNR